MDEEVSQVSGDGVQQYWLQPTATALAKLDKIQASVYHMKPASAIDVQAVWDTAPGSPGMATPPARSTPQNTASPFLDLETKPPLSALNIQKNAWGSNSSIPDLIKAQAERQKQKAVSSSKPRRPWSGKKVPPSPPPTRRTQQAENVGNTSPTEPKAAPFIAVQGSKSAMFEPGSRPSSGRPKSSSSSSTVPPTDPHDVFEQMAAANTCRPASGEDVGDREHNTLEEFLKHQPNGHMHELSKLSAAYADERIISPPPPPPCASPDLEKLISGGFVDSDKGIEDDDDDGQYPKDDHNKKGQNFKEVSVKQSSTPHPKLLRRPTPEPLKLSMTLPLAEGEEYSTDDDDGSSDAVSPQLSPDLDIQSVTSDISTQLLIQDSQLPEHPSSESSPTHSRTARVSVALQEGQTIAETRGTEGDGCERRKSRGRQSVHFVEEKNVTIEITPRNAASLHRPRPPSAGTGRQRPQSALKTSNRSPLNSQVSRTTYKSPAARRPRSGVLRNTGDSHRGRASASKGRIVSDEEASTDGDVDDDSRLKVHEMHSNIDTINNNTMDHKSTVSQSSVGRRRRNEIETMMSRLEVSENAANNDKEEDEEHISSGQGSASKSDIIRTVQVSSSPATRQNFYESAIRARKQKLYERQSTATIAARTLTTKVIEFGDEGPSMETKDVAYFAAKPAAVGRGPRTGWEETSTAPPMQISRATVEKKSFVDQTPARPTSRMGSYDDTGDLGNADEILAKETMPSRAFQRVRPRAAMFKARQEVVPHRCGAGRKSPSRNKQRPHSSYVSSLPPKKPTRRGSSPSGQPHSNSSRALVPTPNAFKSKSELQRSRDAAKALRDGSLTKSKVYGKQAGERGPASGQMVLANQSGKWDKDSDSDSIDEYPKSVREEDVFNLHRQLTKNGIKVSYKTLKRGLVAPDERNLQECVDQLPSNVSLNLLSRPQAWLGDTYEKYRMADSALKRLDHQIAVEEERTRREAEKLLASVRTVKKKKRKKKKTTTKRKSSSASSASASTRSGLSSAMSTLNNLTGEMLKESRASSAPSSSSAKRSGGKRGELETG